MPWSKTPHRPRREVIAISKAHHQPRPGRSVLIPGSSSSLQSRGDASGLSDDESGSATIEGIATREACSKRHIQMTISLAFLALSLVKAAVEGRLLREIGVARPFDAPVAWSRQQQMLGLTADASR